MENKKLIKQRQESETFAFFAYGEDYYRSRNTEIMNRVKKIYTETTGITTNPFGADHKVPGGHFKRIVMQKVGYLLGNGVIFGEQDQTEELDQYFKTSMDEFIIDAGLMSSKKAEAWAYAYFKNGQLKFKLIPPEQITYEEDEDGEIIKVLRTYEKDGEQIELEFTKEGMRRFKTKGKKTTVEELGHYSIDTRFQGEIIEQEQRTFKSIPFIPLFNNAERTSDLYDIKNLIDVHDIIVSDFANNIDDMQEAFYTIKGYTGDAGKLSEFMRQLKQIKVVPIGADGDMKAHQGIIPTEARESLLRILKQEIYETAMAIDLKSLTAGNITNVVIKAMFADLDLKANQFENEIRKFIYGIIDFINENDAKQYKKEMNFERSLIINRAEAIDSLIKLRTIYSDQTIREQLPFEIDLEEEEKRIAEQQGQMRIQIPQGNDDDE